MSEYINSVKEIAKQSGLSEQWIRQLCKTGKLSAVRLGREWVILQGWKK